MKNIFTKEEKENIVKKINNDYYKNSDTINQEKLEKVKNLIVKDKFSIEDFALINRVLEFVAFVPVYDKTIELLEIKTANRLNKITGKSYEEIIK